MWAGVIALGAIQHAGEVERRVSAPEPSTAEVAMQARSTRQIRAAWGDIGQSTAAEPVIAHVEARASAAPIDPTGEAERPHSDRPDTGSSPTIAIDLAAAQKTEPETPQEPERREAVVASASSEAVEASEDPQPQVEAASVAPPTGSARRSEADESAVDAAEKNEQAPNATEARHSPTAVQAEGPVETLARRRPRGRLRARSSLLVVAAVFVVPGEFVAARYFTVYGLNGRAP